MSFLKKTIIVCFSLIVLFLLVLGGAYLVAKKKAGTNKAQTTSIKSVKPTPIPLGKGKVQKFLLIENKNVQIDPSYAKLPTIQANKAYLLSNQKDFNLAQVSYAAIGSDSITLKLLSKETKPNSGKYQQIYKGSVTQKELNSLNLDSSQTAVLFSANKNNQELYYFKAITIATFKTQIVAQKLTSDQQKIILGLYQKHKDFQLKDGDCLDVTRQGSSLVADYFCFNINILSQKAAIISVWPETKGNYAQAIFAN